jgi:hypothetical protein
MRVDVFPAHAENHTPSFENHLQSNAISPPSPTQKRQPATKYSRRYRWRRIRADVPRARMSKKKRPMFSSFAGHSQLMLRLVLRCVAQERLRGWATPVERHNLDLQLSCPGRKLPTRNSRRLSRTSPGGVQMRCTAPPLHPLYLDPGPRLGRPVPSYNAMAPGGSRTPDATPPRPRQAS